MTPADEQAVTDAAVPHLESIKALVKDAEGIGVVILTPRLKDGHVLITDSNPADLIAAIQQRVPETATGAQKSPGQSYDLVAHQQEHGLRYSRIRGGGPPNNQTHTGWLRLTGIDSRTDAELAAMGEPGDPVAVARRVQRDTDKARYQRYREMAPSIARLAGVEVPNYATVQVVEGGAFVEAVVFVPSAAVEPARATQLGDQ